jgi:predicted aspartyl protease
MPSVVRARALLAATVAILFLGSLAGCTVQVGNDVRQASSPIASTPGAERTIPLQVIQAPNGSTLALVPVYIDGKGPFAFALDTGASQSTLDLDLVHRLDLPLAGSAGRVVGVAGAERAQAVKLQQWRVGDVQLPPRTAITVDLPGPNQSGTGLDGLLGSDVLSQFGVITVDYQRQQLILGPKD